MDLNVSCELVKVSFCAHDGLSPLPNAGRAFAIPISITSNFHVFCTDPDEFWGLTCAVFKETRDVRSRIRISLPLWQLINCHVRWTEVWTVQRTTDNPSLKEEVCRAGAGGGRPRTKAGHWLLGVSLGYSLRRCWNSTAVWVNGNFRYNGKRCWHHLLVTFRNWRLVVKYIGALLQLSPCEERRARLPFSRSPDFKGSIMCSLDLADKVFWNLGCTGMPQKHGHASGDHHLKQDINDGKPVANI